MQLLLAIAIGGATGALARHFVAGGITRALGTGLPYGTFTVNIMGSFAMGLLVALFAHKLDVSQEMRAFLAVGFLGSFTTFSTYSLETVNLVQRGDLQGAVLYAGGSLIVGVLALYAGLYSGRLFA